ncbi:hypothetical protein [Mitsuokella jalaludinii]|uniref:hypothetical protein n=1 Tax=Mitsuokella jalaludinii TaxID=187979 RepID=UPI00298BE434|nr:hypothetical protein [Mitsuokella jalaludinii]
MLVKIFNHVKSKKGQGMVEYALIIAFVVAVAGVALKASTDEGLGKAINSAFTKVTDKINNYTGSTSGSGNASGGSSTNKGGSGASDG